MIVDTIKREVRDGKARLSARMVWEDCDRPGETLYFETDERYAQALSDNANAFLLSTAVPAMHFGEKRLWLEGEVCPELNTGVGVVLDWFRHWFDAPNARHFQIEAPLQQTQSLNSDQRRTGFLFSGGIDSYAVLCGNRRDFSPQHSGYIKDGIVIYGLEMDQEDKFDHVLKMLRVQADEFGLNMIPVFTNIYLIHRQEDKKNHFSFWKDKFHSAALTAAVHALDRRIHTLYMGSSNDIPNLTPCGSHPVIEPNYSSAQLKIKIDGVNLSRFEKTRLISNWDNMVNNLRVCNHFVRYEEDQLNCGVCSKCVRTTLALEALGKLKGSRSFPYDQITVEMVRRAFMRMDQTATEFLPELIIPLQNAGRVDLAKTIQQLLKIYQSRQKGRPVYKRALGPIKNFIKREVFKSA